MKIGPRYKICKRLGNGIYEKCQTQKFTLSEARKAAGMRGKRPKQLSDYGKQLLEKQRVRATYGITERQFQKYVKEATKTQGSDSVSVLLSTLERRLDNIVYRLGFAPTRRAARQMVVHGHIKVDGKRAGIPSHIVKEGQVISVVEKALKSALFENFKDKAGDVKVPTWLSFNSKSMEATVKSEPTKDTTETMFDLGVVFEYYSR